jgi:uncharacterized protein
VSFDLECAAESLKSWAAGQPTIRRLWVYGSRLKGTYLPESDLDVCVKVDRLESEAQKEEFQVRLREWQEQLSATIGVPVHIQPCATDQQRAFIAEASRLLYARAV